MKQNDVIEPNGHLEIWKVYPNGEEVLVFDEDNTITSGMGVGLGLLYAGSGADDITNFQIRYFQVGVKGDTVIDTYGVSSSYLASALGQIDGESDYKSEVGSTLMVDNHELMAADGSNHGSYYFATIPDSGIKRVDTNSVTYILYLDRHSCNLDVPLNEVGLFMQNPLGYATERSQLVAYRPFADLYKTSDYSLIFKWTLHF